ncbi:bifunctional Delta(1)-pyrroline-2-carboxylate/Delta(1)-piperideine-2-carboxylate reductase [Roseixanthobacter pseudopolyaromaticivorans]|uniref:ornithine cyclodeaminase family protein n=1 Tax=Xanthobacteraceae TaxID=335928 RepID=UPI00372703C0
MPKVFSAAQIHAALDYPSLVDALRDAFAAQKVEAPVRQAFEVGTEGASAHLLTMPAWERGVAMGVKMVTVVPGNSARGLGAVNSIYTLFDGETGAPRAILDGDALTNRRTAAASALASSYLSRPESRTLLLVGTGHLAGYLAAAHVAVRPIARILVWGRAPEKARCVADRLKGQGLDAHTVSDLKGALAQADIVSCATTSTQAIVLGADVRPGTHVDLVGAFTPAMRESDDALIAASAVYVDTRAGALAEAGDLRLAMASGAWSAERLKGDLSDLCTGRVPGRTGGDEITLFKSVGAALEDLTAARLVMTSVG